MSLDIIDFAASTGTLRTIYERVRARPQSPVYRDARGGSRRVGRTQPRSAPDPESRGDLEHAQRRRTAAVEGARDDQRDHGAAASLVARGTDLSGGDLPAIAAHRRVATLVTIAPWRLRRTHRERAHAVELDDEDILHVIVLAALSGHLDRIANAVAMPAVPRATVTTLEVAPVSITRSPAISLARRPFTATALAAWRTHVFWRDAPLRRRQRTLLARWVALWLGDGGLSHPGDLTLAPLDEGFRALAREITLAPWRLSVDSYAALRQAGVDDATLFDLVAVASTAGMLSRIGVALGALGHREG